MKRCFLGSFPVLCNDSKSVISQSLDHDLLKPKGTMNGRTMLSVSGQLSNNTNYYLRPFVYSFRYVMLIWDLHFVVSCWGCQQCIMSRFFMLTFIAEIHELKFNDVCLASWLLNSDAFSKEGIYMSSSEVKDFWLCQLIGVLLADAKCIIRIFDILNKKSSK